MKCGLALPHAAVTLGKIVVRDHNMTEIIVTVYNELTISESVSSLRLNGVKLAITWNLFVIIW